MSVDTYGDAHENVRTAEEVALDMVREWSDCTVIDTEAGRVGEVREPETATEALEWSHVDALLFDEHVTYGVGLRVRPYNRDRRDLSLRYVPRSGEGQSEYHHLLRAMESGGLVPKWYVVAMTTAPVVRDLSGVVLRHLFVVDTRMMLEALDREDLDADGPYPSGRGNPGDDSEAIYVSIDDLRNLGAVSHEVHHADWD